MWQVVWLMLVRLRPAPGIIGRAGGPIITPGDLIVHVHGRPPEETNAKLLDSAV